MEKKKKEIILIVIMCLLTGVLLIPVAVYGGFSIYFAETTLHINISENEDGISQGLTNNHLDVANSYDISLEEPEIQVERKDVYRYLWSQLFGKEVETSEQATSSRVLQPRQVVEVVELNIQIELLKEEAGENITLKTINITMTETDLGQKHVHLILGPEDGLESGDFYLKIFFELTVTPPIGPTIEVEKTYTFPFSVPE